MLPAESFRFSDELIETFADNFPAILLAFLHQLLELLQLSFQGCNLGFVSLLSEVELLAR